MANKIPINSIICGDCRDRLKDIKEESVDLIYLDPPFFSGKDYDLIWKKRASEDTVAHPAFGDKASTFKNTLKERRGDEYSECDATVNSFEEAGLYKKVCGRCGRDWGTKSNGEPDERCSDKVCNAPLSETIGKRKNDVEIYVGWLKDRLEECHRVLKPTGSIYVHLDWHASHYVKVMMDDIFGYGNFQNEIVWYYKGRGMQKKRYQRKHDTLLFYSKSKKFVFNGDDILVPYDPKHVSRYNKTDTDGRKYADIKNKNGTYSKIYLKDGLVPNDVWDMPFIHGNEALGYPTQKPEALLERIIKASSNTGDVILDPFCGCGTAIKVAQDQKRKWIGIDIEEIACAVMKLRLLRDCGVDAPVRGFPEAPIEPPDMTDLSGIEFQRWVVEIIDGRQPRSMNETFDGFIGEPLITGLKEGDPIEVKKFDKVGTKYIKQFTYDLRRHDKKAGLFVALGFAKTAEREADDVRRHDGIMIHLMTLTELLEICAGRKIGKPKRKPKRKHQKGEQSKLLQ